MSINIRLATKDDLHQIVAIYNEAIIQKGLTADLDIQKVEDKISWFETHNPSQYPIFVATNENDVLAWVSMSAYREGRKALARTTEVSLYVAKSSLGQGIGSALMKHIMAVAQSMNYANMIAILIESNQKSVGLFTKFKFERWGLLPGIVEIDDQKLNHCIYGRNLL
jgi:phosphinothricin acetyltransferase